jgi:signal transduction histidine kinase
LPVDAHARRTLGPGAKVSGEELRGLAEEQAALRRVATLVARGEPPNDVFTAVVEEVAGLLPVTSAAMGRFEPDGLVTTVAAWSGGAVIFPASGRWDPAGNNVTGLVFSTGRPARLDDFSQASGPIGIHARNAGYRSAVGSPITVEGQLWGVMSAASNAVEPLPADTEERLASFTELVAAAIANADSRGGLARLAEEQAALRRVATLVARGVAPEEAFTAVVDEVGQLLPVDWASMSRYESDRTLTCVASWSKGEGAEPLGVGSRQKLGGNNLGTIVFETRRPARLDEYAETASGPLGAGVRNAGIRSAVATPIIVEGRLWGVIAAGSILEQPLPADSEARLGSFTALVATAIANAESRAELARLAEEQAALRRVATLVAQGAAPEQVFAAAVTEVGQLLPVDFADLARYEPDNTITMLATWGVTDAALPRGARVKLGGKNISTVVAQTAAPARIESYSDASGAIGAAIHGAGVRSAVGTPIIVEGRLWGTVAAGSSREEPMPADIESRLASFTELVATAIANAESRAELTASRARIVAAADESRRRIERDLHDGAQQRLVHAVIVLKLALRAQADGDTNAGELVAEALRHAEQANSELRELAHGILPAALTRGGLRAGVEGLVSRVSLPVSVVVEVPRLPAGVEATAYFVISEALTNVAKHARAHAAEVTARIEDGELRLEVRDDGIGGARGGDRTGLRGLADRVTALGGQLVLDSPVGGGTRLRARLPVPDKD